jgi:hypothetical protein
VVDYDEETEEGEEDFSPNGSGDQVNLSHHMTTRFHNLPYHYFLYSHRLQGGKRLRLTHEYTQVLQSQILDSFTP